MTDSLKFIAIRLAVATAIAALLAATAGCTVSPQFVRATDAYDRVMWPVIEQHALPAMPPDRAAAVTDLHTAHRAMIDEYLAVIGDAQEVADEQHP